MRGSARSQPHMSNAAMMISPRNPLFPVRLFRPSQDILVADWRSRQCPAEKFVAALVWVGLGCLIVSHESAIAELKKLIQQDLSSIDVAAHTDQILRKSDHSAIDLEAGEFDQYGRRRRWRRGLV